MQIRFYGFEWHLGKGVTLDEFLKYLCDMSGNEVPDKFIVQGGQKEPDPEFPTRVIALTFKDGFWVGVLLTIKNMRAFCEIKKEGNSFIITPKNLEQGTNIVDFNFFLIHPNTGRGLYQHYHQSAASNTFCYFCKRQYDQLKKNKIDIESKKSGNPGDLKKIHSRYKGSLRYSTIVRPETLPQLIQGLKSISSFSFEFDSFDVKEPSFSPLSDVIKRISHDVKFVPSKAGTVKEAITEFVSGQVLRRGKIKGIDPQDNEVIYKLANNFDAFATYDYHNLVQTVSLDSTNLIDSVGKAYIINELIKMAKTPRVSALLSLNAQ